MPSGPGATDAIRFRQPVVSLGARCGVPLGECHTFSCRFRGRARAPVVGEGAEPSQDDPGVPGGIACGQLGKFGAVTFDPADGAEQARGGHVWVLGGLGGQGGEEDEPGLAFTGVG